MNTERTIAKSLNDLARHQMISKLLHDILIDLSVCELEGWDKKEYITMLHNEIDNFFYNLTTKGGCKTRVN